MSYDLRSLGQRRAARTSIPATSDADFLVELDPNGNLPPLEQFFGLVDALSDALGRPVDLVENHEFRNPYLAASINECRELVYAS